MKIAVASSDGENVDLHFGKASKFIIYEFDGEKVEMIDERKVNVDFAEKHQWMKTLDAVRDCDIVIAVQAGLRAKFGLEEAGIKFVSDEGPIDDVIRRYIKHYKFMKS
ncbi:NifB/NifX family molybdenum-iron cluster-binding protein [Methanothermobacter tenebrarum]|uniref:FeMo cofactor biosynthesis protein n=1 Tax=Methanothermobacter tenebrarum TaxID=680118 RepID=A0A328PBI1_9EURY|nr:NifB/NifX family molybdenum-iron cluster-binding protein [Methanothermobacter tenebrarum]MBC7117690.1 FeMo cofactor biosynthesis protein [Methanobacteriaceae archaeon]NPV64138.1 FeMo cofactor biosynthesis protein [Methanobacteriaceae archaeon]RAO79759.1 FeMo cofactor biosynthesis protein [Methanothermobacter tenebrarum]